MVNISKAAIAGKHREVVLCGQRNRYEVVQFYQRNRHGWNCAGDIVQTALRIQSLFRYDHLVEENERLLLLFTLEGTDGE